MPSFDIEVKETQWCLVEIEADNLEEALEKVNDMYEKGEIVINVTHNSTDYDWEIYPLEED